MRYPTPHGIPRHDARYHIPHARQRKERRCRPISHAARRALHRARRRARCMLATRVVAPRCMLATRVVAPRRAPRRAQPTLASGGRCFAACRQLHAARFPTRRPPCAWHAADTQLDGVPPKLRGAVLPDPLPVHIVVRALSTTRRTKRAAQLYRASRLQHRRTTAGQRAPTQPGDTGLVQGCCVALGRAPPLQTRARNASHRTCRWIRLMKCSAGTGADPCHICTGTGAHRCHICTGTELTAATSARGLGLTAATSALGLSSPASGGKKQCSGGDAVCQLGVHVQMGLAGCTRQPR